MPSELDNRRIRAARAELDRRWNMLGELICRKLNYQRRSVIVEAEYQAAAVWAGLYGEGAERITRNRGATNVVPFAVLPKGLTAWLGYQEVWDQESGRKPFVFRQAGITIHVGEVGDPVKPQLLRLEWPGLRDWDRSGVGFQSPGAGHPHWHIDIFESLQPLRQQAKFDPEFLESVEDFGSIPEAPSPIERISGLTFERMHLASVAPWWSDGPAEFTHHHLNAPSNEAAISRWLGCAVDYVRQELSRCVVRGQTRP